MRIILILLFVTLASCILPQTKKESTTGPTPKIWEQKSPIFKTIKNVQLRMSNDINPGAAANSFFITGSDRSFNVTVLFQGNCSEHLSIIAYPGGGHKFNLDKFLKTRRGENLPISNILYAMKEALTEQCEQLQVIVINYKPNIPTDRKYIYEGTIIKANNWKLQDGKIETAYDPLPVLDYQDQEVSDRDWAAELAELERKKEKTYDKNVWGSTCKGIYCNLPGGLYLNAIYNNDIDFIRKLDRTINIHPARKRSGAPDQSLLDHLARYYMYSSSEFSPRRGMVNKTISYKADSYETYNGYGAYTGRGGGESFSATYIIPTELIPLCEKICSHISPYKHPSEQVFKRTSKAVAATIAGIIKIREDENGNITTVRKFEKNLISLTNRFLDNKTSWIASSK